MTDGFDVITDEVRSHAGEVSTVASGVSDAASAGGTATGFTGEAFGILCSFFTPPAVAVASMGIGSIDSQRGMLDALSGNLPKAADDFDQTDTGVQSAMTGLEGQL